VHVLSACAALGAIACVVAVLGSAMLASPAGLLVLLAFLSFASVPALIGTLLLFLSLRSLLRGRRPVGLLLVSAVLLLPGAALATWIGAAAARRPEDLAPGTLAASRVSLVCGPLGIALAVASPLLLLAGDRRLRRPRVVPLIGWANLVVLVLASATALGLAQPGSGSG
jgi:hypothetical protein